MKKVLSLVFVLALAFSFANAQLGDGVRIYGNGFIYLYGGSVYPNTTDDANVAFSQYEFRGDLSVSKKFEATGGTGVLHLRGSSRDGSPLALGNIRGGVNDDFDANVYSISVDDPSGGDPITVKGDANSNLWIKELYYTQPIADNFVVLTVGKTAYLGNNVGYGALGAAFTDDSVLANGLYAGKPDGANRDTIKLDINPIQQLTISYGYSDGLSSALESRTKANFGYNGYHAVQLNVKAVEKTNIRLGYAANATAAPSWKETTVAGVAIGSYNGDVAGASAFWFGADTGLVDNLTIFAKFSMRLDDTNLGAISVGGYKVPVGMAWQVGSKIGGGLWGRDADAAFVGIGGASFKTHTNADSVMVDGDEKKIPMELHFEINYAYSLDGGLVLTPFVQAVTGVTSSANGVNSVSGAGFAGGLKLGFVF